MEAFTPKTAWAAAPLPPKGVHQRGLVLETCLPRNRHQTLVGLQQKALCGLEPKSSQFLPGAAPELPLKDPLQGRPRAAALLGDLGDMHLFGKPFPHDHESRLQYRILVRQRLGRTTHLHRMGTTTTRRGHDSPRICTCKRRAAS